MDKRLDLHIHSVFSDGKLTPREICEKAKGAGLYGFALTDHDTVAGLPDAAAAAQELGLRFVPGAEISAYGNCEVHIIGLNIDYKRPEFIAALDGIRKARDQRNADIIKKLNRLGIGITAEDIARAGPGSSGRMHIARAMVGKGFAHSVKQAFYEYLDEGRPAYCGNVKVDPKTAVGIIRAGGGKSFLAHPGRLSVDDNCKFALIDKLTGFGLDGIEAYYPTHKASFTAALEKKARENGLLVSGGTDNHGNPGDAPIGTVSVPADFLFRG